jgi:hypothetical protein
MNWLATFLLTGLCWLPIQSQAITERLDDSASPLSRVASQTSLGDQGRLLTDSTTATLQFGRVNYKLSTAKYIGKQARIYYVIPLGIPGLLSPAGLRVEWRGHGLFSNGQARPGERSLVWTGTVREAWMTEGLNITMQVDLHEINLPPGANFGFESYFEIETLP